MGGLPVLVIEAKAPSESVMQGLDEARLYAAELNALFASGENPCGRVVSCNGAELLSTPWDQAEPDFRIPSAELHAASHAFAAFVDVGGHRALQAYVNVLRARRASKPLNRATELVGGLSVRNEEVALNKFGAALVGDYGHLFNPLTRRDRAHVVKNAYVSSRRRERYVEPVDRIIRSATMPALEPVPVIEDSAKPTEITSRLTQGRALEHQILLLIGSVGSGKSTFIDYLTEVALPQEVRERSVWIRVDLNEAPLTTMHAYDWLSGQIATELREARHDLDFDSLPVLEKVYGPELNRLKKGPLALLDSSSLEYRTRVADHLSALILDKVGTAKAMARFVCGNTNRLLVLALDNCDKRSRDEQLTMFQVAQWAQREFVCLIVLPLRDVTYDLHQREPPLDTALKDLVFRIEPPRFHDVLQKRVALVLREIAPETKRLSYTLPNSMKVEYPASDLGMYLASIVNSLFAYNKFVRRIVTGVAGRDVRKALEIVLEFCRSGHIEESEIFKIRHHEGAYTLPFSVVARVLLRSNRRFYDGGHSHVKNLFQCAPDDPLPDNFVRLAILRWLEVQMGERGPLGIRGYHQFGRMVSDLAPLGYDADRLREEATYLLRERCIVAEHQRVDRLADGDLVRLSPAGYVHLTLLQTPDYLAACSEDTWVTDYSLAERIAKRIGHSGLQQHFAWPTVLSNAEEFLKYLHAQAQARPSFSETYLLDGMSKKIDPASEVASALESIAHDPYRRVIPSRVFIGNIAYAALRSELLALLASHSLTASEVVFPTDRTGKSKGFAFVTFGSPEDGSHALATLQGVEFKGRRLRADVSYEETNADAPASLPPAPDHAFDPKADGLRVFVGNLTFSVTAAAIAKLFNDSGYTVKDAYVATETSGRSRGFGFLTLEPTCGIDDVIERMNGRNLCGRNLRVGPAVPKH